MSTSARINQLTVLFKHQIRVKSAYRIMLFFGAVNTVAGLLAYGLLGNSSTASVTSQAYGLSLTSFLVSGVAFSSIITNGLGLFQQYADPSQIEEIMATPTTFRGYALLSSSLPILSSLVTSALLFLGGIILFGFNYQANIQALILVVALGIVSSVGLGFLGLSFSLVYKQASILPYVFFTLTGLIGNMLVPVQVLPSFVRQIASLTPQYFFFTGIRASLGSGGENLLGLTVEFSFYAVSLVGLGLIALSRSMNFIRRHGTHRWS